MNPDCALSNLLQGDATIPRHWMTTTDGVDSLMASLPKCIKLNLIRVLFHIRANLTEYQDHTRRYQI